AETPRSNTSFTASSLNSRLNFRRCIVTLRFQKHLILVSTKPGAAHYLIANTLKHNNPKWGQQLMESKPDLVNAAQLAWLANGDWYDAVQIPHADMLELFGGASESGATLSTPFK